MTRATSHTGARPARAESDTGTVTIRPRRSDAGRAARERLRPTIARWPLDVADGFEDEWCTDPATSVVRRSLADYRSGRADDASRLWHDDIVWMVKGREPAGGAWTGPEQVFAYHRLLDSLSDGTFRQHLVALEGCSGPIVTAYLRTTAMRNGRRLEIPTLNVFELIGGRVSRVTELPGDRSQWDEFWAD